MAKKIVKVTDEKTKSGVDLGKLATVVIENKETIGKVADTLGDIFGDTKTKKSTKKSTKSTKNNSILDTIGDLIDGPNDQSSKTTKDSNILDTIGDLINGSNEPKKETKKNTKSDGLSKVIDIAGDLLKNKSSK